MLLTGFQRTETDTWTVLIVMVFITGYILVLVWILVMVNYDLPGPSEDELSEQEKAEVRKYIEFLKWSRNQKTEI